jgi:hypothetical protein
MPGKGVALIKNSPLPKVKINKNELNQISAAGFPYILFVLFCKIRFIIFTACKIIPTA